MEVPINGDRMFLRMPCLVFIIEGVGVNNQVFRNAGKIIEHNINEIFKELSTK